MTKNPTSTLHKCSTSSTASSSKSFTTVVERKVTVTTTITTTTFQADMNEEDISLYVCVLKDKTDSTNTFTWFKLDPQACTSRDQVPREPLTPLCQMPDSTPREFQAVAFGSEIYTLGGFHFNHCYEKTFSDKVFVCDTLASPPIWKEYPSMDLPRELPAAAAVDGLLYVVGSLDDPMDDSDPLAEVFDPSSQIWATLPLAPPGSANFRNSVFSKHRGELIILSEYGSDSLVHAFHCKTRSWNKIRISGSNRHHVVSSLSRSVAVGDMVYTFQNRNLYAWDLSQCKPRVKQVYGLEEAIRSIPHYTGLVVHIAHIGRGKLCLVWFGVSSQREKSILINCLKFWVGTRPGGSRLHAVIDRCDKYIVDGYKITNCLTI